MINLHTFIQKKNWFWSMPRNKDKFFFLCSTFSCDCIHSVYIPSLIEYIHSFIHCICEELKPILRCTKFFVQLILLRCISFSSLIYLCAYLPFNLKYWVFLVYSERCTYVHMYIYTIILSTILSFLIYLLCGILCNSSSYIDIIF